MKEKTKFVAFSTQKGGAGKTTLLNILYGEIHPSQGQIRYQGRELTSCQLYQAGAYILQSSHVFDDLSVEENIALGQEIDQQRMDNILQETGLLSLKGKVPSNQTLSGGEKQRISIARAILKDAPIVVLDEATAYADPENEHQIQKAFDGLIKNKTVIMVAHRLSTVQDADQILVMKNGAIAESGTHSDLIKHQGEYAKMWDNYNKTVQWHIESLSLIHI